MYKRQFPFLVFDALADDLLKISFAASLSDGTYAQDVAHALGRTDHAARIEQIECMRALQHVIVSRKRQACFERAQAFLFVAIEFTEEQINEKIKENLAVKQED